MLFQALWLSIPSFQHFLHLPAPAELLSLHLELAFLTEWSLCPENPQSISPSVHCLKDVFLVVSPPQASFRKPSCAIVQEHQPFLLHSHDCLHSLHDVVVWSDLSICLICLPVVVKGSFWSIDHCILSWLCWWVRCWMLQDMDHMEASCIFCFEVGTLHRLEQCKISICTVSTLGIAMLPVHHYLMFSICLIQDPGDFLKESSADVLSIKRCAVYISQTRDYGDRSNWLITVNKHTTTDWLGANCRSVGNPCNRQLYAPGFMFCRMCKLAFTHSIMT